MQVVARYNAARGLGGSRGEGAGGGDDWLSVSANCLRLSEIIKTRS